MRTCSCMCVRVYVRAYVWVWMCKRSCVCTRAHSCMYVCVCVNLCMSVSACEYMRVLRDCPRLFFILFYFFVRCARAFMCAREREKTRENIKHFKEEPNTSHPHKRAWSKWWSNKTVFRRNFPSLYQSHLTCFMTLHQLTSLPRPPPHPTPFKNKKTTTRSVATLHSHRNLSTFAINSMRTDKQGT